MYLISCFKCVHNTSITSPKGPFNSLIILIAWVRVLCVVVAHYTFHVKFITILSSFLWHSLLNGHWNTSVHVVVTWTSVPVNVHNYRKWIIYVVVLIIICLSTFRENTIQGFGTSQFWVQTETSILNFNNYLVWFYQYLTMLTNI